MTDRYEDFNDDRFRKEPDYLPSPADLHNKDIERRLREHDKETLSAYGDVAVRAAIIERIQ